jgi:DNA-binding IclR family transcriptional regulator
VGNPQNSAETKSDYSQLVPAVEQASQILLALARQQSGKMSLTEVCKTVGIHNSKGYSILNTLQKFALVQRDPDTKAYSLGLGLVFLSQRVLDNLDLRQAAAPFLSKLASKTKCTAFLGIISGGYIYVAAKDEGNQPLVVTFRLGQRFPLTWGAHGRAILAFLPKEERERILRNGEVHFLHDTSQNDPILLDREITACREAGYGVDMDETTNGIRAVAAPVFDPLEKLIGAFVVVGPFPTERIAEYGEDIAKKANEFSRSMKGDLYAKT